MKNILYAIILFSNSIFGQKNIYVNGTALPPAGNYVQQAELQDSFTNVNTSISGLRNQTQKVFNVKDYGCTGDSSQDATVFIQATINAAYAYGNSTVYFPNGFYWVGGALVTSTGGGNPNAQLYIPTTAGFNSANVHITFRGESKPEWFPFGINDATPYNKNGVIIKSTITGSGTLPCLFGGVGSVTYAICPSDPAGRVATV